MCENAQFSMVLLLNNFFNISISLGAIEVQKYWLKVTTRKGTLFKMLTSYTQVFKKVTEVL